MTTATIPGLYLFRGSQYQLNAGVLDCLRCHLTDSLANTRVAIECAAFTARMKRHDHLGREWIEAATSDAAYEKYRRKFGGRAIFPEDDPDLVELGRRYDLCAKQGHPSFLSLARRLEFDAQTPGASKFHIFDVKDTQIAEPTRTFLWTVDTHVKILEVFQKIFAGVLQADAAAWDVRWNGLQAKVDVHSLKWLPVIELLVLEPMPSPFREISKLAALTLMRQGERSAFGGVPSGFRLDDCKRSTCLATDGA